MCLVFAVGLLLNNKAVQQTGSIDMTYILVGFGFLTAIVTFISDLVFRKFIPSLTKLWVVEGVLVIFIVILIFIIKASIG